MKFFDPVILTKEFSGVNEGSKGYFIKTVSNEKCIVFFNECFYHEEIEVPLEYIKLGNHYDYEMKEYFKYNDITLLVNDYGEIKFTKIVDGYGLDEFYRKPTAEERKELVINYIKEYNGFFIKVNTLARLLGVKIRTIQYLLKKLEQEGQIKRTKPDLGSGKITKI